VCRKPFAVTGTGQLYAHKSRRGRTVVWCPGSGKPADVAASNAPAPVATVHQLQAEAMSEAELAGHVETKLDGFKWWWFHDRDPLRNNAGLPDYIVARAGVVRMIELKTEKGKQSPAQVVCQAAMGGFYLLWRPSDLLDGTVDRTLR
jgi:hypothetical protein